ncbi:MAG TPA: branched-chain amino acid transaminase [Candidatus Saccharimonadia bacterium]|jgi:branched-chain amino acid aminotransferase|nr:branched-chain amino acid transaminase [Candidatus Saccharimonadia bacterium]
MKTTSLPYAFFEGNIVPTENAKVSIMTNALQYGTAFFGGIRGYYNSEKGFVSFFRIDDHITRFLSSANILGCKFPYSHSELKQIILNLIAKNQPKANVYMRPFGYVGNTELGPNFANVTLDFALYMIPLEEYMPLSKGLNLVVSSWQRISDNAIPTRAKISGGYANSALARKEATDGGFDEAILLNSAGHVSEGSAENVFLVRGGRLITPGLSEGVLEGITRRSVIQLAADMGIETIERPIERSELYAADEVFLTGTGCQVAWVEQIDRRIIGDGKIGAVTAGLKEKFFNVVQGNDDAYANWCTKVPVKS